MYPSDVLSLLGYMGDYMNRNITIAGQIMFICDKLSKGDDSYWNDFVETMKNFKDNTDELNVQIMSFIDYAHAVLDVGKA